MDDIKCQQVHIKDIDSSSPPPVQAHYTTSEIDQGNEAVLLRIDTIGSEKGPIGGLRLASDGRVSHHFSLISHRTRLTATRLY